MTPYNVDLLFLLVYNNTPYCTFSIHRNIHTFHGWYQCLESIFATGILQHCLTELCHWPADFTCVPVYSAVLFVSSEVLCLSVNVFTKSRLHWDLYYSKRNTWLIWLAPCAFMIRLRSSDIVRNNRPVFLTRKGFMYLHNIISTMPLTKDRLQTSITISYIIFSFKVNFSW